jgi:two-component system, NarL family, response regulator YdfI
MIDVLVEASSPHLFAEIADLLRDHAQIRVIESGPDAMAEHDSRPRADVVLVAGNSREEPGFESFGANAGGPDVGDWSAAGVPVILLVDNPTSKMSEGVPAGVRAVLPRNVTAAEIVAAIEAVAAGLYVFHPSDVDSIPALRRPTGEPGPELGEPLVEALTPREIEVLQLLSAGLGNKEIASRLSISEHTAKFHVASIMGKLGAATRTEAVTVGIRHGLVMI